MKRNVTGKGEAADGPSIEREAKFSVDAAFELPDLDGLTEEVEALPEVLLHAVYFDAPDLRLWRQGITVRYRTGEGPPDGRWTVKLPVAATGPTLDRNELSWPAPRGRPPEEMVAVLLGLLRHASFGVIAELTTRRRRVALRDATGASLAEVDDDRVSVLADGQVRGTFRQIEVELAPGGDSLLDPVSEWLGRAGGQPSDEPKLARALTTIAVRSQPDLVLDGKARMEEVVRARMADGLDRILDHDVRLRLDPADPPVHSIHQARVATRRLRSDLQLLRTTLDPSWVADARADLQWMGRVLGAVRDADVLGLELESAGWPAEGGVPLDPAGLDELRSLLASQRRAHALVLSEALSSARYLDLLDRLDNAARPPPVTGSEPQENQQERSPARSRASRPAKKILPRLVAKRWRALGRAVRKGGRHPTDPRLHRIRIRAKQLRYAAETAEPVVGTRARRVAQAAARVQGVLGDLHDTVAAEQWLAANAGVVSAPAAFAAGVLAADQVRRREVLRHDWQKGWRRLDRQKVRGWLDRN